MTASLTCSPLNLLSMNASNAMQPAKAVIAVKVAQMQEYSPSFKHWLAQQLYCYSRPGRHSRCLPVELPVSAPEEGDGQLVHEHENEHEHEEPAGTIESVRCSQGTATVIPCMTSLLSDGASMQGGQPGRQVGASGDMNASLNAKLSGKTVAVHSMPKHAPR